MPSVVSVTGQGAAVPSLGKQRNEGGALYFFGGHCRLYGAKKGVTTYRLITAGYLERFFRGAPPAQSLPTLIGGAPPYIQISICTLQRQLQSNFSGLGISVRHPIS